MRFAVDYKGVQGMRGEWDENIGRVRIFWWLEVIFLGSQRGVVGEVRGGFDGSKLDVYSEDKLDR